MNLMYYHKKRPQWSSAQARARKHMTRARAQILISSPVNFIIVTNEFDDPNFAGWLKGVKIGTLLQAASRVINLQFFYLIDIDWRWDQKLLLYFRPPAGGGGSILPATNDSMRKIGDALLDSLH